ncbi:MBOAT family O-acyltransferase [Planctomycetota bacterium]
MLFNSYVFVLVFLPVVLALWWSRYVDLQFRLGMLTLASYVFYGWWDWRFVALLLLSTVVDYFVGRKLYSASAPSKRTMWLCVSMFSNLGLLAYFKYAGFFAGSVNAVAEWMRMGGRLPIAEVVLPIGISFYTFQTMSYSIDLFRKNAKPANSFLHFAAYVSLFPQLIAGPIVRYAELEEQLREIPETINWDHCCRGIYFFVAGMAQKILLADTIARCIDPLFADYTSLQFFGAWFCMLGYTVQLYFDFAGYSNMAVGLGLMLGFRFPQNFDSPYKSANISEFWRRWHMTLSFWLRDYLFIPLGGSRFGTVITLRNLVIVMFLGGLWHGAGWTFVLWGLCHGAMLAIHNVSRRILSITIPHPVAVAITFISVVFSWVLFRAADLTMAQFLFVCLFGGNGLESNVLAQIGGASKLVTLTGLLVVVFAAPNLWQIKFRPTSLSTLVLSAVLVVCVLRFDSQSPFLYFQF